MSDSETDTVLLRAHIQEKDERLEKRREQRAAKAKAVGGNTKREGAIAQTGSDVPPLVPVTPPPASDNNAESISAPVDGSSASAVTGKCNTCSAVFFASAEQKAHYR